MLNEGLQLDAIQVPSKTFRKLYKTQIALQLVNASAEAKEVIRKEIEESVEAEPEHAAILDMVPRAQGGNANTSQETAPEDTEAEATAE